MNFKRITTRDYPALKKYFKNQPHMLSSYSLSSILVWENKIYKPCGVSDEETLFISYEFPTQTERGHLLLPVSPVKEHSPKELSELAKTLGFKRFSSVPASYMEKFGIPVLENFFNIVERKEYDDYVYLREDLAYLKGNRHSKKRNLINQFLKNYVSKNRVSAGPITTRNIPECLDFLDQWCEERNCDANQDEDLICERDAAKNALENIGHLDFNGILLRIDNVASAFGIASFLTRGMGALHFEKAFAKIKGLYQYFDRECARRLFNGLKYINKESDMGVEGLAKAKKSYRPVMMVKSYDLLLR